MQLFQGQSLNEVRVLQAVGQLPPGNPIPWRGNALLYEQAPKLGFDDLTGGWMQGGVAGGQLFSA